MNIQKSTQNYERWLSEHLKLDLDHLEKKHRFMASDAFIFLRATYYRWAQIYPEICPDLQDAPRLLSVADLHIENFGTWRDEEGRLIWGINDFDEAYPLPYSNDLVRLATSANLAIHANHLRIKLHEACTTILAGYTEGMAKEGKAFVLEEEHKPLRLLALSRLRDPVHFWQKIDTQVSPAKAVPGLVKRMLKQSLPEAAVIDRIVKRQAGQGSLGRQRFVALAHLAGARIAREAKALAPSACLYAAGEDSPTKILYAKILKRAVRCPDPFVHIESDWVLRRLAPDCSRIDLSTLPEGRDEAMLLFCMGREIANVHHGTPDKRKDVLKDLYSRHHMWLERAVDRMSEQVDKDHRTWRKFLKEA